MTTKMIRIYEEIEVMPLQIRLRKIITNETMNAQTSTLNELMLQNLEVKTNTIIADCINLTNKVDILIQNSNRSIFNELNAFFANLILGNYVQVSPLLTRTIKRLDFWTFYTGKRQEEDNEIEIIKNKQRVSFFLLL